MGWVVTIILLCIISIYLNKNIINPASILLLVWSGIMVIYQYNIGNLDSISEGTYVLITLGLIGFVGGVIIDKYGLKNTRFVIRANRALEGNADYIINYKLVLFLCVTSIIILIPEAISSIMILRSGGTFETIRTNFSSGFSVINNSFLSLYRNYFVKPFMYIIYPLSAIDYIFGKKKKWLLLSSLILAILNTFYEGGRIQFVYLIIQFLLIMKLGGKKLDINIPKAAKRAIFILAVVSVLAFLFITSSRGSSSTFSHTVIIYTSGCVPLLDKYLNSFNFHPDYKFGLVSISGILKPIFALLENIGLPYPSFLSNIQHVFEVEKTISIGSMFHMNAYVSQFYYLFYDGGYIGTFIIMLIYGMVCERSYKRTHSFKGMLIYAMLVQGLLFSMIRFQFTISHYCISFILATFMFKVDPLGGNNEYTSHNPVERHSWGSK